jgi:hypothetical protein
MPSPWMEPASNDDYPVVSQDAACVSSTFMAGDTRMGHLYTVGDDVCGGPYFSTIAMPSYAGYIELEENTTIQLRTRPAWYARLAMRALGWRWVDIESEDAHA